MQKKRRTITLGATMVLLAGAASIAQDYAIDWHTIDGGGDMFSTGGDFELSGTIGQPDAGDVMTGGDYELAGGFWPGVPGEPQFQVGDLNAFDIDPFVLALTDPVGYEQQFPDCDINLADINGDGTIDAFDIDPFVELLVGG